MLEAKTNPSKTILAFHPSAMNDSRLLHAVQTAKTIAKGLDSELIATTVADTSDDAVGDFESRLGETIKTHVIVKNVSSPKKAAEAFIADLSSRSARAVVVITHLPKSPAGKLMHHFSRDLLSRSRVPILVVHAQARPLMKIGRILFATDFSPQDHDAFLLAVNWASELKAELVLANCLLTVLPLEIAREAGAASVVSDLDDERVEISMSAHQSAREWCDEAAAKGVRARFEHVPDCLSVSAGLLRAGEEMDADMIVVTRRSKPGLVAGLLGSTVQDLLAASMKPVLIFSPDTCTRTEV